jgi:hypothetical protein
VSPKNLALIAAAVAVLGMGVYLFVQVRATSAQAQSTATAPSEPSRPSAPERVAAEPPHAPPAAAARPTPTVEAQRPGHVGNATVEPQAMAADEPPKPNIKLDSMMELANKAYDAQDFDQATAIAGKVLAKDPTNVRMLRIMVSANCIAGDSAVAQEYFEKLPKFDREQMKVRCDRYGVTFKDPPQ